MARAGAALIRKRLRQRFGISAPKVAVRTHVPWYWQTLLLVGVISLSLALAAWMYDVGRRFSGFVDQGADLKIELLASRVRELEGELTKLRQAANSSDSSLQIERSAKERLAHQVAQLEQDNASLKEDLAFFESIVPGSEAGDGGLKISRLRIEPEVGTSRYRYRLLIMVEGGRSVREFRGNLQFGLKVQQAGKDVMMIYPKEGDPVPAKFRLEIKRFLRTEGVFELPSGVVLRSAEARLIQDGEVRARQALNL